MHIVQGPNDQWSFISPKIQGSSSCAMMTMKMKCDAAAAAAASTNRGKITTRIPLAPKRLPSGSPKSTITWCKLILTLSPIWLTSLVGPPTLILINSMYASQSSLHPSTQWLSINKHFLTTCIVTSLCYHYRCPSTSRFLKFSSFISRFP